MDSTAQHQLTADMAVCCACRCQNSTWASTCIEAEHQPAKISLDIARHSRAQFSSAQHSTHMPYIQQLVCRLQRATAGHNKSRQTQAWYPAAVAVPGSLQMLMPMQLDIRKIPTQRQDWACTQCYLCSITPAFQTWRIQVLVSTVPCCA